MQHRKHVAAGYEKRRNLLIDTMKVAIPERPHARESALGAKPDDLLDAIVAAATAHRMAIGKAQRLPHAAEFDGRGLRMEMVY
jgi:predicted RNase H-like nuclease